MGKNTQSLITREFSSGGVVFKKENGQILWLVGATAPNKIYPEICWRLPKGWIDDSNIWGVPGPMGSGKIKADEDSLRSAALREVREEGGVEAKIVAKIGSVKIFFKVPDGGNVLKFVTYYLMQWLKDLPEGFGEETSEVLWLPYEEARKKLSYSGEKKTIDKAKELLESGVQSNLPL